MVGLPGSGKSYVSQQLKVTYNAEYFSSDLQRIKVCGDVNCQSRNHEVFNALYNDLKKTIKEGKNCIFDATNVTRKSRKTVIDMVKDIPDIEIIAYVMNTKYEDCCIRDGLRERCVGENVIKKFYFSFEFPQRFEGFHDIIIHDTAETDNRFFECTWRVMEKFDQENPHHIRTLGEHCKKLAELTQKYRHDHRLYLAGCLHDIGKIFTQFYDEQHIAHYYSHDNVGTYEIMTWMLGNKGIFTCQEDIEYILFLVNYHMKGHKDWRTEKYRKLLGDEWYNDLVAFADCDIESSGTESIHEQLKQWIKVERLTLKEIRNKPEYEELVNVCK